MFKWFWTLFSLGAPETGVHVLTRNKTIRQASPDKYLSKLHETLSDP